MIVRVEVTFAAFMDMPDDIIDMNKAERNEVLCAEADEISMEGFQDDSMGYRFFTDGGEEL